MEASKEEARKKRDSEVKEDAVLPPKKQRSIDGLSASRHRTDHGHSPDTQSPSSRQNSVLDLETAIQQLVKNDSETICCESSPDQQAVLRFRYGNGGDACALSKLYQNSKNSEKETDAFISLDIGLSEALGNEELPPSAFALIAEFQHDEAADSTPSLPNIAAAAILVQGWDNGSQLLRVEWLYVLRNHELSELIERRVFLRLCTLAHMTLSDKILVVESNTGRKTAQRDAASNTSK